MRNVFGIVALAVIVAACSARGSPRSLESIASGLTEAMQPSYADFTLEVHPVKKGDRVTLRCVLRNISAIRGAIEVDASSLPRRNADFFDVNAVPANGRILHRKPPPVALARISAPRSPLSIANGESVEGEMDLGATPIGSLPSNEDLLLL